ncbi:MAG: type III pantothenate kinase [Planctomycetia bacterium]|nr:type III pantothenate kinase [Planctomycetia bacterium]
MPRNLAIDIGNTRCKIGDGENIAAVSHEEFLTALRYSTAGQETVHWWVASVNHPMYQAFQTWVLHHRPHDEITFLNWKTIPIETAVEFPERVGSDRLLAAVAANRLRTPGRPAIVVDLGTALKVDLIDENGVFQGGAIGPGLRMSAHALYQGTDALPELDVQPLLEEKNVRRNLSPVGRNTHDAMEAGLYWGIVGAIRELVSQTSRSLSQTPDRFITGGGAGTVCQSLCDAFVHVPEMVMRGIFEIMP